MSAFLDVADERLLLERSVGGDRDAFDRLVARYRRMVLAFALRLTRDRDEADDIVVEAFARAHRSLDSFRGNAAFSTWLCRIVTNCHLDRKKKAARRPTVSLDSPLNEEFGPRCDQVAASTPSPMEGASRQAAVQRMMSVIAQLPPSQRDLLILFHVKGLPYDTIADRLNVPLGTVKSRLNRARLAVRDKLAEDAELFA